MSAVYQLGQMSDWDKAFADPTQMQALYTKAEEEAQAAQHLVAAAEQAQGIAQRTPLYQGPQKPPASEESFFLS